MQAFAIFDPCFAKNLNPDQANEHLECLLSHYGKLEKDNTIENVDVNCHANINPEQARIEWVVFDNIMKENCASPRNKRKSALSFYKDCLHPCKDAYPNICKLAVIGLVIPVTSIECEIG